MSSLTARMSTSWRFPPIEQYMIVLVMSTSISLYADSTAVSDESCHVAQLNCHARSGCQRALNNFFIHCRSVIKGDFRDVCPTDCKNALVSLLSTEDEAGLAFINCDCHQAGLCSERKERVEVCKREVLASMHVLEDNAPPVSCNLARWICEADTSCQTALRYYYDYCSKLFKGVKCTSRCKNSLFILSRQPHASKLRSCLCDGTEDYDCPTLKVNTENMCFTPRARRRHRKSDIARKGGAKVPQEGRPNVSSKDKRRAGHVKRRTRRRKRRNRPHRPQGRRQRARRREPRKRKGRKRRKQRDLLRKSRDKKS
ncbi:growth arrest-specific protein 1 [Aplysia californica]|uniref:Growth arrest-specific protein 1 n=1 Tax=Aplysia californica TaxID=6500 RepID=A0ABM1AFW2_APLCA|nr:growth arrest-specific protein 1 [Aplysia californica]